MNNRHIGRKKGDDLITYPNIILSYSAENPLVNYEIWLKFSFQLQK